MLDRIKYDGPGGECTDCRRDASPGQTRCPSCGKPFDIRPWLVFKYPGEGFRTGSQLIVGTNQEVLFAKGGTILDRLGSGTHTLETANLPFLRRLVNAPFDGETPFPAEAYFVNRIGRVEVKWGTTDPIQLQDPRYGILLRVRSFGQFSVRIRDSQHFVTQLIGAMPGGQLSDPQLIVRHFRSRVLMKLKDTVADRVVNQKVSPLEITASLEATAERTAERLRQDFERYGLDLIDFNIESLSMPEEDLAKLRTMLEDRAAFEILGDDRYGRKRQFDVMEKAAANSGPAGAAMGMNLGMGLAAGLASSPNVPQARQADVPTRVACHSCGQLNPQGTAFCPGCGTATNKTGSTCPSCKAQLEPNSKFCGACGTKVGNIQCAKCGAKLETSMRFCGECGEQVDRV